jgi:drug/metabolite transporter (DMT)-like permease
MSPYLHAILAALSRSTNDVVYRRGMLRNADPLETAIFNSFAGGILILIFTGVPSFKLPGPGSLLCLICANILWAGQTFFYLQTLQILDVGISAIMDCLRYVLLVFAGAFIFYEPTSLFDWLGVIVIAASILFGVDVFQPHQRRGLLCSLGGVLCGSGALMLDKHLTSALDANLVILAGFFLPGILYLICRPRALLSLPETVRHHHKMLMTSTVLISITGCNLVYAFGSGHLGLTMTIYQSSVVFTFALGVVVLKERSNLPKRAMAAILCLAGIAIISLA